MSDERWAYLVIPREVHDDKRLDWAEIVLFSHIHAFTSQGLECWMTLDTMAHRVRKSDRMVSIYLKKLKNLGLIRVTGYDGRRRKLVSTLVTQFGQSPKHISDQTRNTFQSSTETHFGSDTKPISDQTRNTLRTNNTTEKNNVKEQKNNNRAKPISVDEVIDYFAELDAPHCAERFFDHYTANGWRQGKGTGRPIKDWKAAARNWKRNDKNYKNGTNKTQSGFDRSNHDVDRLKDYIATGTNNRGTSD